mmetsp:Transcript_104088/g.301120  ORF Transcript_104088/g.301120 Transcript_104088/m.301120 type:complete len:316 (-) Transcript_104088:84-1031(-)|eukprot:CAMPEP_0176119934 /NCGR_PEP_ID=MMETSP0120_2-20121206/60316_1 /TAXON_ID=160619 /ORGANISM="Kryptoperidinium foliaceum, Strain CCMP 1326" /LENGTH=315 /DNA_ID=CAMNT_0017454365 /DNA_START=61 /DNA_END=1008 /DNA_ORIENTATION=+
MGASSCKPKVSWRSSTAAMLTRSFSALSPVKAWREAGGAGQNEAFADNPGKISDHYDLAKKNLGKGAYGAVVKATCKDTGEAKAVKVIVRSKLKSADRFKQEIAILKDLDHKHIIRLDDTFEDSKKIYLVMELCAGGELFDRIIQGGHFTEPQASILMQQIVMAISYLHANFVCHRDLKPENFLFASNECVEKNSIKIVDFGLACKFKPGELMTTKAGTPYYVAPEVLQGKYDHRADCWSLGVILYAMLCGYPPFFGGSEQDVLAKVREGSFTFSPSDWSNTSEGAKDLVRRLLKKNPKERFTTEQVLNHSWIAA